jgi:uncharacterized pyridoxamine 5'-phosphate oxidase family protein
MAFLYRNQKERVGWQFMGRARVDDDQQVRDQVYEAIPDIEKMFDPDRNGVAVIIDLDRVSGRDIDMRREEDAVTEA